MRFFHTSTSLKSRYSAQCKASERRDTVSLPASRLSTPHGGTSKSEAASPTRREWSHYTSGRSEDEPAAAEGQRFTAELQRAPPFRMVGGCDGTPSLWTALGETPGLLPLYDTPMAGQLSAPKSSFSWGL